MNAMILSICGVGLALTGFTTLALLCAVVLIALLWANQYTRLI